MEYVESKSIFKGGHDMTVQERYNDICRRSGFSEEIVRRVLTAETDSCRESLRRGEKVTLMGRCTIRPNIAYRASLAAPDGIERAVRLKAKANITLEESVRNADFDEDKNTDVEVGYRDGIMTTQIGALV